MEYVNITSKDLEKQFIVVDKGDLMCLKYSHLDKPIFISKPFVLDENVANLAGLMPDGSLIKDLMRIYFSQKKDLKKIQFFAALLKDLFNPKGTILFKEDFKGRQAYINSQTLARFFYHIIGIPKSNESMRIPKWVFSSSDSVKRAYLRSAFDMEGTVLKKLREIRFVSKDKVFAEDIQNLLFALGIKATLTCAPRPKQKSPQYRVHIYRKENFTKFKEIGFTVPNNRERFNLLLDKYKIEF